MSTYKKIGVDGRVDYVRLKAAPAAFNSSVSKLKPPLWEEWLVHVNPRRMFCRFCQQEFGTEDKSYSRSLKSHYNGKNHRAKVNGRLIFAHTKAKKSAESPQSVNIDELSIRQYAHGVVEVAGGNCGINPHQLKAFLTPCTISWINKLDNASEKLFRTNGDIVLEV